MVINVKKLIFLFAFLLSIEGCSGKSSFNLQEQTNSSEIKEKTPINLMKEYALDHYLDKYSSILYLDLFFAISDDYSSSDYIYEPSSFISQKFVDKLANGKEGFAKLEDGKKPNLYLPGLDEDMKEKDWYKIGLQYPFLIKDFLDLLDDAETKDYIYFVYGSHGGGSPRTPTGIIETTSDTEESLINSHAIRLFDDKHNFLDGYYNEFNICLAHQVSGTKEYSFKEILPSFSENDEVSFYKINDQNEIDILNEDLPSIVEKKDRDWYKVVFPFRMEAQFALQLYKELEFNEGVFYATSSLTNDSSLPVEMPQFIVYRK